MTEVLTQARRSGVGAVPARGRLNEPDRVFLREWLRSRHASPPASLPRSPSSAGQRAQSVYHCKWWYLHPCNYTKWRPGILRQDSPGPPTSHQEGRSSMASHDPLVASAVGRVAIHERHSRNAIDPAKAAEYLRLANEARVTLRNLVLERKLHQLLAEVAEVAGKLN